MLCGLVVVFVPGVPAWAEPAAPPLALEVRLGFDGALKIGVPVPMEIRVPPLPFSGRAVLLVEAPALGPQAGTVTTSTAISFEGIPGVARTFHLPVIVSDIRRPLTIRVLHAGGEVFRRAIALDPIRVGSRVIVAVSSAHGGLAFVHRLPGRVVAGEISEEALPSVWQEYSGVDLLAVRDLDPARLDDAQRRALLTWIQMGGRLLLVVRPGASVPEFLGPVLPADVGEPRTVSARDALAQRYGADLPAGPLVMTALAPHPGADEVRAGGVPVIATAPAGWGRVTMWSFDPWEPPFRGGEGSLRLWADVLGSPPGPPSLVDAAAVASRLPDSPPLDPQVHVAVGAAVLGYVLLQYVLRRRLPSTAGAVGGLVIACLGLGGFTALAADVRNRSTALTQATFLEQAPAAPAARALTVAVVAVPYGGPYLLRAPRDATAGPATSSGDLRLDLTGGTAILSGRLRAGESGRPFEALGTVPLETSGTLSPDIRILRVDLRSYRLHRAQVLWRDRLYPLGDLPSGASVHELRPDVWVHVDGAAADDRVRAWIFRGSGGDAIMKATTPVLVGEMDGSAPAFAFAGTGAPGQRLTILLVPLARR
ncbi:MAG TPA: hypothetical protein VFW01_04870 [bacterium]|nr:hypothetical protein [bacterium]